MDSNDRDRIDEARQELHRILSDREMKDCLLLVFANKQDIPGGTSQLSYVVLARLTEYCLATVMTPTEVTEKLGLLRMKDRSWYCHPSNALEGDGLFEGQWKNDTQRAWSDMLTFVTSDDRSFVVIAKHQEVGRCQ